MQLLTEEIHQLPNGVAKPWIDSIEEANSDSLIIDLSAYVNIQIFHFLSARSLESQDVAWAQIASFAVRKRPLLKHIT